MRCTRGRLRSSGRLQKKWCCAEKIVREGVEIHAEYVEPKPQKLPYLRKNDMEPSSVSHRSVPVETTWAMGVHLNPPGNLSLALSFPISSIKRSQNTNSSSVRVGESLMKGTIITVQKDLLLYGSNFSDVSST